MQALRIRSDLKIINNKKDKSSSTFDQASVAIRLATSDGKTCLGGPISKYPVAESAFKILQTCNSTAAASCDSTDVQNLDEQLVETCIPELQDFVESYTVRNMK